MKWRADSKLRLMSKTFMDFAKAMIVGTSLFTNPSIKFQLTMLAIVGILFFGGWALCPEKEEREGSE